MGLIAPVLSTSALYVEHMPEIVATFGGAIVAGTKITAGVARVGMAGKGGTAVAEGETKAANAQIAAREAGSRKAGRTCNMTFPPQTLAP